jgi:hypothetical protein
LAAPPQVAQACVQVVAQQKPAVSPAGTAQMPLVHCASLVQMLPSGSLVQVLLTQMLLAAHAFAQPLQLLMSVLVLTQTPLQLVRPAPQLVVQLPVEQTWPAEQALPQAPQLARLFVVSTQIPLQHRRPARQFALVPHEPPAGWTLHSPGFTQAPAQLNVNSLLAQQIEPVFAPVISSVQVWFPGHGRVGPHGAPDRTMGVQVPVKQPLPAGQTWPQAPQLLE